jgi:hypothetical protein
MLYQQPHTFPSPDIPPNQPAGTTSNKHAHRRRLGATAMEYLFVLSLILIVAITAIGYLGQETKASAQKSVDTINNATSGK